MNRIAMQIAQKAVVVLIAAVMGLACAGGTFAAEAAKASDLPKESIKHLFLAQQAGNEKDYDKAIRILTEYMAEAKETIPLQAYQMLGFFWYQKGDKAGAFKAYAKAHAAYPQELELLQNYAVLTYESGQNEEAAQLFEKLYRAKGKTDKKILYNAAGLYFQSKKLNEAKRVLTELLSSGGEPEARWYDDMIGLCVELKQWQEAEKWTLELLEMQPGQAKYWRLIAQMRLDREQYKAAASALEIAYRLEAPKAKEWLDLADLYLYLNAPLMAIRCLQAASEGDLPAERKAKVASLYARTGRVDQAVKYIDELVKKAPTADLLYEKGKLLSDAMRFSEAIAIFEECIRMDPSYGRAYITAGFAAWSMGNFEKSRSLFAAARSLPKFKSQADEAVAVLDDLIEAIARKSGS